MKRIILILSALMCLFLFSCSTIKNLIITPDFMEEYLSDNNEKKKTFFGIPITKDDRKLAEKVQYSQAILKSVLSRDVYLALFQENSYGVAY